MRLIHKATGAEVQVGDAVTTFRNEPAVVVDWRKPHKPASSGFVTVRFLGEPDYTNEYYAGVVDCEWIEREDRL